jgi:LysR family transcriptional regulator, glycine cleavage system transcriptional activator
MPNPIRTATLSHLVAFEAAARTGSFTRAAAELSVSQPAISHAMRNLESELGVSLFQRQHKGVATTEAGRYLLEQVGLGLTLIDQAVREVRNMQQDHQVTLAVSTATATWWLLPRIAGFKQLHPDIELRCITTDTDLDLDRERIDLAITLGSGEYPRLPRWHFVDEEVFPVCSPSLLERHGHPADAQALSRLPLLHLEERYRPRLDWPGWLARFGVSMSRGIRHFRFNDYSIVLQAAREGQGVALGWRHIVEPLLATGALVRPIDLSVTTDQPIHIVASRAGRLRPDVMRLRDWLVREAVTT